MIGALVTPKKVVLSLAALAGGVLLIGLPVARMFGDRQAGVNEEQLAALTVPVEVENLAVRIEANGIVEPIQSVNISPKTPGRLAQLLVEQGDVVTEGQELAIMDNSELYAEGIRAESLTKQRIAELRATETRIQGEIEEARARYIRTQAQLQQAEQRIPKEIDQANAQLAAAQANLQRTQDKVERFETLLDSGAIAQETYDDVRNEFDNASARFFEAQQRLAQVRNTANPELEALTAATVEARASLDRLERNAEPQLTQLTAALEQAQAQRQIAAVQFQDSIIRAPFDGVITQKFATEGAFVTPTTAASSTASATSSSILALARGLEVVARVPEVDIQQIEPGQDVEIVADADPAQVFRGRVLLVAPEAIVENNVTSFEVRIALLSGREFLRSKMNTDVTFVGQNLTNVMTVPTVAIATENGETGVLIPDANNTPQFKPVIIGATVGDRTQIVRGVTPEDRVFIDLPENLERPE
ncbi:MULTISPECIES: efflux RND transporter periplasmic adaptor subunit [Cyanophyceae]|uniref:efflux RND transporter periplasmic adaptor subunit n=1 Tax=Cyanophyceae TaxID=3028117 RepID=UPI00016DCDB7|nr:MULTISPECIES: efflux RND transporter periplasmic adaptor subunit [Cyanophyceae]ACB00529.1 efflux transporter, RND family, MFP subunit [Picosynechococcus sp. PCC 7002]ANV88281.1 efflux transporter periplasmic adaptor subunit [Picosynechococcus sp. PCC 7117]ANV91479.1 efflux transporter periplasmic adaptor subunit [Picosynechococcus sp. PCC 8807]QCS48380.1 HlyD family efflux transporter periplasmic adaptor subunit [Picosynechococcus sp. PCC 11901]SMH50093.1 HlyD family secretion protein [Pico